MPKHCLEKRFSLLLAICLLVTSFTATAQLNPPIGSSPWGFANPKPTGYSWLDMSFVDNQTGLAVGTNGGLGRTTDSGRTWLAIPFKYTVILSAFFPYALVPCRYFIRLAQPHAKN